MMIVPEHGGNGGGSGTFQPGSPSVVTHSRSSPSSQSLTESFWYSGSVSLDCAQILMLRNPQPPPKKLSSIFVTEICPTPRISSTLSGSALEIKGEFVGVVALKVVAVRIVEREVAPADLQVH